MKKSRNYVIIDTADLGKINFSEVMQTSASTVRKSVDGTKAIIKWEDGIEPRSLAGVGRRQGPYTQEQILGIVSGPDWTPVLTSPPIAPAPVQDWVPTPIKKTRIWSPARFDDTTKFTEAPLTGGIKPAR
jgi:hypothetical protein